MPQAIPTEESGVLVLFHSDVAGHAISLVEQLRSEGLEITTSDEFWDGVSLRTPVLQAAEEAVTRAKKVIIIPSPLLFSSASSSMVMEMAIVCGKAIPALVGSECQMPLRLRMLTTVDLTDTERYEEEMERLIRSLGKKEDEMPTVIRPGSVAPKCPPPAGLVARCPRCGAELRTEKDEPNAVGAVFEDRQTKTPGWDIPCPECGYQKVFFRRP